MPPKIAASKRFAPLSLAAAPMVETSAAASSIEWLRRMSAGDHADDSFIDVAEDLATWQAAGPEERRDAVGAVWDICRDACPVQHRCVGDQCRYYRIEHMIEGQDVDDDDGDD